MLLHPTSLRHFSTIISGPQLAHLLRVVFPWERWVVTLLNLLAEGEEIHLISIEGALESCHLQGKEHKGSTISLKV